MPRARAKMLKISMILEILIAVLDDLAFLVLGFGA
jgi:hypothetical protein